MIYKVKLDELCTPKSSNLAQKDILENHGNYPVYGASGFIKNVNFFHQQNAYIAVIKDGAGIGRTMFLPPKSSIIGTMQYLIPKNNVDPKYLYYAVRAMNLSKYYSGATIPHIYFKDYKKELVPLYSGDKQKMISLSLEKLEDIIAKKLQLLSSYDQLIKSRFVEMFGDIFTNEKRYRIGVFNDFVTQMNIGPFGSALKNDYFVSKDDGYCMVYEQKHAIRKNIYVDRRYVDLKKYNELSRFEVGPGDLIVSCRGTIGECHILPNDAPRGIIHPSLMMIKPKGSVNGKFLLHLLERILERQLDNGSGVKMAIQAKELAKVKTIVPDRHLQDEYVLFVEQVDKLKFDAIKKYIYSINKDIYTYNREKG